MPELPGFGAQELTEQLRFILELGVAVAAALLGGAVAARLRQPVIIGYLLAGIIIGPFGPGLVQDGERIAILAEVGIVLLLFALGVEFSIRELRRLGRVALPGAVAQIGIVIVVVAVLMAAFGFGARAAFVIGACISISSTIVVLKSLLDRGELDSLHGRIAIGWMIVQDIATIVFIVALPPLAGGDAVLPIVIAVIKAAIFLALAYVLGTRLLPWLFVTVARLGSNELFLLAVVSTALLTAFVSSAVFGLSLALGAFVAGLVVSESDLAHQAAAEVTPFRDLFAVFFFVSVGMLLDPAPLVGDLGLVAVLVFIAVVGKSVVSAILGRALGVPSRSAILLGAAVAQVGEFSFILAENALHLELIDPRAYNLILGTAVVTILASSLAWRVGDALVPFAERHLEAFGSDLPAFLRAPARATPAVDSRTEQQLAVEADGQRPTVVVLGAGRVGRVVIKATRRRGFRCVVVDRDPQRLDEAAALGAVTIYGDAASPEILKRCGLDHARVLVVAIGDPLAAPIAAERALRLNPRLAVASRARGRRQIETLRRLGVNRVSDPEAEVAFELARHALQRMGVSSQELAGVVSGLRRDVYGRDRP